ncbi:MAG: 4-(cytidine 5'-diphospho)-2-C-methyl-D-erythritol kinase [Kordiimonadaceae bacterium]|nr:4-(cytidine 5'-diphospho)-2-C-methyl-D-erythritol kinase [Kordiimonadaceae bacterium]
MLPFEQKPGGAVRVVAPAKVNIFLHITGRRSNGFHELESLFAYTEQGDRLLIEEHHEPELSLTGPFAEQLAAAGGADSSNLVYGALLLLAEKFACSANVKITLEKNLPIAAGIGGGSADAAAALIGLCAYWGKWLPIVELEAIAFQLGADVPSCLHAVPLLVRGVGESFELAEMPGGLGIVLVNPHEGISTPQVFEAYKANADTKFDEPLVTIPSGVMAFYAFLRDETHNALQGPATKLCPEIGVILEALDRTPDCRYSGMSGSGATCFALFDTLKAAEAASNRLKSSHSKWWVHADSLRKPIE